MKLRVKKKPKMFDVEVGRILESDKDGQIDIPIPEWFYFYEFLTADATDLLANMPDYFELVKECEPVQKIEKLPNFQGTIRLPEGNEDFYAFLKLLTEKQVELIDAVNLLLEKHE